MKHQIIRVSHNRMYGRMLMEGTTIKDTIKKDRRDDIQADPKEEGMSSNRSGILAALVPDNLVPNRLA